MNRLETDREASAPVWNANQAQCSAESQIKSDQVDVGANDNQLQEGRRPP